jgi:hypothetical protein
MSNSELYTTPEDTKKPAKAKEQEKSGEKTLLDQLTSAIKRKVERQNVHLSVPERPNVKLIISPNITQNQLRSWRRQAGEETKNGMDALRFACLVVGHTTRGILFNDEEVRDDDGNELTFASDLILQMTETTRPQPDCVRAFFGVDPHVESAAVAILEAAGYSDTVDTEDPMRESSTI